MQAATGWAAVALLEVPCASGVSDASGAELAWYRLCISNERSGTTTVIEGAKGTVVATIPLGKRPRETYASPDGLWLHVALSGSKVNGPPPFGVNDHPLLKAEDDDDDADHTADGTGVVALKALTFVRKLPAVSNPEKLAGSTDRTRRYISHEDMARSRCQADLRVRDRDPAPLSYST